MNHDESILAHLWCLDPDMWFCRSPGLLIKSPLIFKLRSDASFSDLASRTQHQRLQKNSCLLFSFAFHERLLTRFLLDASHVLNSKMLGAAPTNWVAISTPPARVFLENRHVVTRKTNIQQNKMLSKGNYSNYGWSTPDQCQPQLPQAKDTPQVVEKASQG